MDQEEDTILTPGEVAALFNVQTKTVTRWANSGRLQSFRTIGGHRRFYRSAVMAALSTTPERTTP